MSDFTLAGLSVRLTKAPDAKQLPSRPTLVSLRVAVNDTRKTGDT